MKNVTTVIFTLTLLLASIVLLTSAEAEGKEFSATHNQLMKKLENLTPGDSIEVLIAAEKETYSTGDNFELRFQVSKDSYIVLMHISTEGDITFFAPSYWIPDNVKGQQVYSTTEFNLPILVAAPGGIETINLFCSPEKINLFEADLNKENAFYMIKHDEEEKLKALLDRLDQLEQYDWSGSGIVVSIKDPEEAVTRALPGVIIPPIGTTGTTGKNVLFPPIGTTGTTGHSEKPIETP